MKLLRSYSSEETKKIGTDLAESLLRGRAPRGHAGATVIALTGDLGAGKTTFTQGLFRGLGLRRRAVSPTFVIMRHYRIPAAKRHADGFTDAYHVDAYRLKKAEDAAVLGFEHMLAGPEHIVIVEWPERIRGVLPKRAIAVRFAYGKKENERIIKIS